MKLIMENWRKYIIKEVEEPIETYGQLRKQLKMAIALKKGKRLAGLGIGLVFDALGAQVFKDVATFAKTMYKLPDNKKTGTVLDVFLNVDDNVSAIVDDKLENAFLQDFIKTIQEKPDDEKITSSVTQELQKWIASKYNANTVKK